MSSVAGFSSPKFRLLHVLRALGLLRVADHAKFVFSQARVRSGNRRFIKQNPRFAVPPQHLAFDALNHVDWVRYQTSGLQHAGVFARIIRAQARQEGTLAVLEWGCGPGRLIRHLSDLLPGRSLEIIGADYNPESTAWCKAHLPGIRFVENALNPPLPLAEASVDVVYNFSVFTHLSEAVQLAWAQELQRVLKPGGLLICTTHGDNYRHLLSTLAEQRAYAAGRSVDQGQYREGRKWFLAIHPPAYVREQLLAGWQGVAQVPTEPGDGMLQDVWMARKPVADDMA